MLRTISNAAAQHEWSIETPADAPFNGPRCLFHEMYNSRGSRPDVAPEFLFRILRAVQLAEKDFYPVFEEVDFFIVSRVL